MNSFPRMPLVSASGFHKDATVTLGIHSPLVSDQVFPLLFFSESSEEESTGEREEETSAHDEVNSSTKATEVPAEQTSNTQTGDG